MSANSPRPDGDIASDVSFLAERVADAAHCLDQTWLAAGFGLAAEVADVDVERVRGEAEVVAPDALEDDRARQHLAGVEHEQLEQVELGARELDAVSASPDLTRLGIELEVREAQDTVDRRGAAAQQRPHSREQLVQSKGLDEIVVGAGVEAFYSVSDRVTRGQHQHRDVVAGSPEAATDLEPVDLRHQDVQDDGV